MTRSVSEEKLAFRAENAVRLRGLRSVSLACPGCMHEHARPIRYFPCGENLVSGSVCVSRVMSVLSELQVRAFLATLGPVDPVAA